MKKLIQVAAIFITIATHAVAGNGVTEPGLSNVKVVASSKENVYKLYYNRIPQNVVKVTIIDSEGIIVYSEKIRQDGPFVKVYNLSLLPDNKYSIEVIEGKESFTKQLFHDENTTSALRIANVKQIDSNRFLVIAANNDKDIISVSIYSNNGELLYKGDESIKDQFAKIYNLSRIEASSFKFVISDRAGTIKIWESRQTLVKN